MMYLKLRNWFKSLKTKNLHETSSFFEDFNDLKKINLKKTLERVSKSSRSDLIFEPIGFDEWFFLDKQKKNELVDLLYNKYFPKKQIMLNMPKINYNFRPIAYLHPSDSIIYQGLIDTAIKYKKDKFSKSVYSNIINSITSSKVFHAPVLHWLEMRATLRSQFKKGNKFYYFADISGYFENIKIEKLLELFSFYIGRNEKEYINYIRKILNTWGFASSQGVIQPHCASSILGKIYLAGIDSHFSHLNKKYARYVDEFHILSDDKTELLKHILHLHKTLREIGLNINSAKSKFLYNKEVIKELSEDQDFFNMVNYIENVQMKYKEAKEVVDKKYKEYEKRYFKGKSVNNKIFRFCLNRYIKEKDPIAIDFCLKVIDTHYDQVVNIVRYLAVFVNDEIYAEKIVSEVNLYIKDVNRSIYAWVRCWYLQLLLSVENKRLLDFGLIKSIFNDKNFDDLSRSVAILIFGKNYDDHDLLFLSVLLKESDNSILIKRSILVCLSKLPSTIKEPFMKIENEDIIDIIVLKTYLKENTYKIMARGI